MTVSDKDAQTIQKVCEAMQAGANGEDLMVSLFEEDGVLVEPFSGQAQHFVGHDAIRARYREMTGSPRPPDFTLTIDQVYADADSVFAEWSCTASVMPVPLKGRDEYHLRDGKIQRLEIRLLGAPRG